MSWPGEWGSLCPSYKDEISWPVLEIEGLGSKSSPSFAWALGVWIYATFHVWLTVLWPSFLLALLMPFPFSNINNLFLSYKIPSIFFECLHTCVHFEYLSKRPTCKLPALQRVNPEYFASENPCQAFLRASSINGAGSSGLKRKFYWNYTELQVVQANPHDFQQPCSRMVAWYISHKQFIARLHKGFTELPTLLHFRANSNKKKEKTPPHSHSGLSTKPPFNFLVPLSRQLKPVKGLNKIHWCQEDHTANVYPSLPEKTVWGSELCQHCADHLFPHNTL